MHGKQRRDKKENDNEDKINTSHKIENAKFEKVTSIIEHDEDNATIEHNVDLVDKDEYTRDIFFISSLPVDALVACATNYAQNWILNYGASFPVALYRGWFSIFHVGNLEASSWVTLTHGKFLEEKTIILSLYLSQGFFLCAQRSETCAKAHKDFDLY